VTVVAVDGSMTRYGRDVSSVFDLLGRSENDLTAALAFTLAHSPLLLSLLMGRLLPGADAATAAIRVETRDAQGRTDLEIDAGPSLVVIEAKRGWVLPCETQLAAYGPRVLARGSGALASLSSVSPEWAAQKLPATIMGVPVLHLAWAAVRRDLDAARARSHGRERLWLSELRDYLGKAIRMRDPADCWTYCVAISTSKPGGGGSRTFRDFVTSESCYFHPYGWGSGWPSTPPNFLAFRWDGRVQRIHRVTSSEIIPSLQELQPDIPADKDTTRPHALYRLGRPLPVLPVPSGGKYRAARVWFLLDQLLTSQTLTEAIRNSKMVTGA
jgi:hypothetical protein